MKNHYANELTNPEKWFRVGNEIPAFLVHFGSAGCVGLIAVVGDSPIA